MSSPAERAALTGWEKWLRAAVAVIGVLSVYFLVSYLFAAFRDHAEFPFLANSVSKDVLFAVLCLLAVIDVRRFLWAVYLLIVGHVALVLALVAAARWQAPLQIEHTFTRMLGLPRPEPGALVWTWAAADAFVVLLLGGLVFKAQRARYDMRYLWPGPFRALAALAEVLVLHEDREITPQEVAQRADHYLAGFAARGKWKIRVALHVLAVYPTLTFRPPFHLMSPDARRSFVRRRFYEEVADHLVPARWAALRQAFIRAAQQMCYLGYYNDERAWSKVGYTPFSKLPHVAAAPPKRGARRPLTTLGPRDVRGDSLTADVVIVGSGAAGATLAAELAGRGREVLVLERGRHVDPADFSEDEPTQLSSLFADGALTLSRDFRFQALQGRCVGGSTVVNNAVCFRLPDHVLDRWLDRGGGDAGLDPQALHAAFDRVECILGIGEVAERTPLNGGAPNVVEGVRRLGLDQPPADFGRVDANVEECLGCGYCNTGCAYGRKLSMLDTRLPRAQHEHGTDAVRVLAECEAEAVVMRGPRAAGVRCRLSDGRRITVAADDVVVAGGAIASSLLLQASGLGDGRAGNGLSFNLGSPMTFDFFPEVVHSERGLTITHYLIPDPTDGLAFETWYQPVVSQSLFMPGWFDDHYDNMRRYSSMTCFGVVVGSESNGRVRRSVLGTDLDYEPTSGDLKKLVGGLELAGEIGFAAEASRVMPATLRYMELNSRGELKRLKDEIREAGDLSVNSSHPQGGNPLSRNALKGVVAPDFRLYGTKNVWVCDASVFPSSITVNPQLTVMALATLAAAHVAG